MTTVPGSMLRLLADLEEVVNQHLSESEELLHFAPISLQVHTVDGEYATLYEEGWSFE